MSKQNIHDVRARCIWNSSGLPALEIEIILSNGMSAAAIVQSGLSGGYADPVLNSNNRYHLTKEKVNKSIFAILSTIKNVLIGFNPLLQDQLDILISSFWQRNLLSRSETAALSLAIAEVAAKSVGVPLWQYLQHYNFAPGLPLAEVEIFGGGAHANNASAVQDIMVIVPGAKSYEESLHISAQVFHSVRELLARAGKPIGLCEKGGLWPCYDSFEHALGMVTEAIIATGLQPGTEIGIAIDFAADSYFINQQYHLDSRTLTTEQYVQYLVALTKSFPLLSYEDPLAVSDKMSYRDLMTDVGNHMQIISDDLFDSDASLMTMEGSSTLCNAIMIKPAKSGTLTHTIAALKLAREKGWGTVMAGRSIDSENVAVMHLAVGLGIGQFKIGSLCRSERSAKYNEGIRISDNHPMLEFAGYKELIHPNR